MPRFGLNPTFTGTDDLDLLDIPTSDALGAAASQAWATSPTPSSFEVHQLDEATEGRRQSEGHRIRFGTIPHLNVPAAPKLPAAEARAKIAEAGLDGMLTVPADGLPGPALDILIAAKKREQRNAFIADRYRGGVAGGAAQLGTALAVSLADPVNIGSAFVPIVGEARYASLLQRAGTSLLARGGVRAGVGAIEGSVGAAILEPMIYSNQRQLQADYDTFDSLMNVGFGGLFGGVLHSGGGGVADLFARRAGTGAWAESIGRDGLLDRPDLPDTFVPGGGTRWVDGDDYARGQFALVEAERLGGSGERFGALDPDQVGASPYAGSGAPVLRPDGGVVDGSRRVATLRQAYADGQGEAYRGRLLADAAKYGLDAADVAKLREPVLVRVEGAREVDGWKAGREAIEATPTARAKAAHPTETPEFRGWFGGSKVVEAGTNKPLRVYHGTPTGGFDRFDSSLAGRNTRNNPEDVAFHFSDSPRAADYYAGLGPGDGAVMPVYLSMKNPMAVDDTVITRGDIERAKAAGHDGIVAPNSTRTGVEYVVFDSKQIKSAIGNSGKFDPNSASLTDALTEDQAATALRIGIAQAVNGADVDVAAARHLDGTREGVARFLDEKRQAETAAATRQADEADAVARAIAAAVDVTDPAKIDAELKALEADIRAQMEAAGDDLAAFEASLAEADELAAATKEEGKALLGAAMCMERS